MQRIIKHGGEAILKETPVALVSKTGLQRLRKIRKYVRGPRLPGCEKEVLVQILKKNNHIQTASSSRGQNRQSTAMGPAKATQ